MCSFLWHRHYHAFHLCRPPLLGQKDSHVKLMASQHRHQHAHHLVFECLWKITFDMPQTNSR